MPPHGKIVKKLAALPCRGKIAFSTEIAARMGAQAALTRGRAACQHPLYVYRCRECSRWHMTSQPPRAGEPTSAPVTANSLGMESSAP